MESDWQRMRVCGFFSGMDDTLSVNRKEFPGGGRCTDQQEDPHIDFPTSEVTCMHCCVHSSTTYWFTSQIQMKRLSF